MQDDDSIRCRFFLYDFHGIFVCRKTVLDYTNLFSPRDHKKKDKIIYKYFKDKYDKRKRKP